MPKFIQVTRSDVGGRYVQRPANGRVAWASSILEGELDDINFLDPGTTITFTVVEMSEEEYAKLPEFEGW